MFEFPWTKKRRLEREALAAKEVARKRAVDAMRTIERTAPRPAASNFRRSYSSAPTPAPTVIHKNNSMNDMLLGGLIGYQLGQPSHHNHESPTPAAEPFTGHGGEYSGAGASSSWDSGSSSSSYDSSSSSSSDSSSSSSSDSGSSCSGSSD